MHRDAVDAIIAQWQVVLPDIDVSPLKVFGRLHRTFLLYRTEISSLFAELGTSEPGFDVLAALRRAEPSYTLTAGELAEQTLVTTGGLTLRVKKLEEEGLVVRHRDANDQRVIHVQLTASGMELIDRAARSHYENLGRLKADLSAEEAEQLSHLLARLFESISTAGSGRDPRAPESHTNT
ncbi:MarR family winged helix-turn-helix transcriptional regulator [Corynebacterium halotolerans]|uniref:MarR family winged helix-turn-helix transcriptional regulator n=1 Tax=Corynebacterium halotolerans TaxID=225326 RepID=UPI003CF7E6AF